jgi:uncharacterized protein (DUF1697 family)
MDRQIVLLRGINLGPRNRIAMPELRSALGQAGYTDARTYVQSGNIVLQSDEDPGALEEAIEGLIAERFGLEIPAVSRTRKELARVVKQNPLADVATDPKRYQVSFLSQPLDRERIAELNEAATEPERLVAVRRELYAWHPDGVARSKLWAKLAGTGLGVKATARNWTTVEKLLAMADE